MTENVKKYRWYLMLAMFSSLFFSLLLFDILYEFSSLIPQYNIFSDGFWIIASVFLALLLLLWFVASSLYFLMFLVLTLIRKIEKAFLVISGLWLLQLLTAMIILSDLLISIPKTEITPTTVIFFTATILIWILSLKLLLKKPTQKIPSGV